MIRNLTQQECKDALAKGKFEGILPELAPGGGAVALILTQSWCPQWAAMKAYLERAEASASSAGPVSILFVQYDTDLDCYEQFMAFKENVFKNREIPYIRYYFDGKLQSESNFVSFDGFIHRLCGKNS
jgi:hypothetical protein